MMKGTSTIATLRQIFHCLNGGYHIFLSPPYHPQSNGMAERAIGAVKNILQKNQSLPIEERLFGYRTIPLECGKTPAELLLSHLLCTCIHGFLPDPKNQPCLSQDKFFPDMKVWVR
uniref:Uncharacterized protein K02A2.6like [Amphimedon queenslandica] n=1 Tax=Lepeophtheirus salmonis TaxID=72036 RepID=A0A0K2V782_LEPSM